MSVVSIQGYVDQLSPEWFQSKLKYFQAETFYDQTENIIYDIIRSESWYTDDQTGEEIDLSTETEININFNQYCWSDYYPDSLSSREETAEGMPLDGNYISSCILQVLESIIEDVKEVPNIHQNILGTIDIVSDEINRLCRTYNDVLYHSALAFFLTRFREDLTHRYRHIKRNYNSLTTYKPKLEFSLNQEELGALLYFLNKAEVFFPEDQGDTRFLNFCQDHFYFLNGVSKTQTRATQVKKKFNDAKNLPIFSARDKVRQLLMNALKE